MITTSWVEKRKPHWDRLEQLVGQTGSEGIRSLTRRELRDLGLLYRQTAADLSTMRGDPSSQHFARYLNQLLSRAHNIIYAGRKSSALDLFRFYSETYPRVFHETLPFTVLAVAIFAIGALAGLLLSATHPEFMHSILGPSMVETIERREMWTHSVVAVKPLASSSIMTNNLSVAFITFASGITAGLGTVYLLAFNGLMLGVIGYACWAAGMSLKLWSFVAPHGVLELPAIFIAGGAGLRVAHGLLFPGYLSRRDSVGSAGVEAVRLLVGTIPMLIIAGIIEGFVSPTSIPAGVKFATASVVFSLLAIYLFAPRDQTRARSLMDKY